MAMIVFSDIDGTLLDPTTYGYADALPGIELLKRRGIPLVLVSSKTYAEVEPLHRELGLGTPFVFESGAGIAIPGKGGAFNVEIAGRGIDELRAAIPLVERTTGKSVVTILDMPEDELADYTGLSLEAATLAKDRRASLPFVAGSARRLPPEDSRVVEKILASGGLTAPWGGRFHQLRDFLATKERAVARITSLYAEGKRVNPVTVGIGDSENDFCMLDAVDRAYLVRNRLSGIDYSSTGYAVTGGFGPAGFTEAVRNACGA